MLNTLALLLLYQLGGELVARFFGLPIPGPVIGMTLLLLTLLARGQVSHDTRTNVGAFLKNLKFTLQMENEVMAKILDEGKEPEAAATEWLAANPDAFAPWLAGVTTKDGGDATAAVKSALGL